MIIPKYEGRIGNNMFQYVFNRIIATKMNIAFYDDFNIINNFPVRIVPYDNTNKIVLHNDYADYLKSDGYFQDHRFYDDNSELVKSFFEYNINTRNDNSIVMHVRLTDYYNFGQGIVIHPDWYMSILDRIYDTTKNLYILSDNINDEYMINFKKYNPIFINNGYKDDFQFIMNSDTIISSNSTFCWWASWLSGATDIYTFKPWIYRNHREHNLSYMDRAESVDGKFL